jgi:1-acyl-sn-glycerol-3-phosphate acyltransferase
MDHAIFKVPLLNFIFRTMRTIPIAAEKVDANLKERAFTEVASALRNGELVGIFPEGAITANGEVQAFRPGISRILGETPVPVIPMALRGLWGSFFSRKDAPAMTRPFRRGIFSRIDLIAGEPVGPAQATPDCLRAKVLELAGENNATSTGGNA